jgi:hypothetical protein
MSRWPAPPWQGAGAFCGVLARRRQTAKPGLLPARNIAVGRPESLGATGADGLSWDHETRRHA